MSQHPRQGAEATHAKQLKPDLLRKIADDCRAMPRARVPRPPEDRQGTTPLPPTTGRGYGRSDSGYSSWDSCSFGGRTCKDWLAAADGRNTRFLK